MANNLRKIYYQYQEKHGRISINKIAQETGVSGNTIARWIDDPTAPRERPNKSIVRDLCAFFGVERNELLGEENAD